MKRNKRDTEIGSSTSLLSLFISILLEVSRTKTKPVNNIHNLIGLILLTRLRLDLSHLNERKFQHNFRDCALVLM